MIFHMKKRFFFLLFHSFAICYTICSLSNVVCMTNERIFNEQQCSAMNKKNVEHDDDDWGDNREMNICNNVITKNKNNFLGLCILVGTQRSVYFIFYNGGWWVFFISIGLQWICNFERLLFRMFSKRKGIFYSSHNEKKNKNLQFYNIHFFRSRFAAFRC